MRSWRSLALTLVALSLVAFVVACSGDDSSTSEPTANTASSRDAAGEGGDTDFTGAPDDSAVAGYRSRVAVAKPRGDLV